MLNTMLALLLISMLALQNVTGLSESAPSLEAGASLSSATDNTAAAQYANLMHPSYALALRSSMANQMNGNSIDDIHSNDVTNDIDVDTDSGELSPPMQPFLVGRPNRPLMWTSAVGEKRGKPSLSITNSLDVLRQQVMLDFARRQMRENIRQIEMNRAHLNSIGKRAQRPTSKRAHRRPADDINDYYKNINGGGLYRIGGYGYVEQRPVIAGGDLQPQRSEMV